MNCATPFNPRQRLNVSVPKPSPQTPLQVPPQSSETALGFRKQGNRDYDDQSDFMRDFIEKTIEYKMAKIGLGEYKAQLLRWFPLLSSFARVNMNINIISSPPTQTTPAGPIPGINDFSTHHSRSSDGEPEDSAEEHSNPESSATDFDPISSKVHREPIERAERLLECHALKIREFWGERTQNVPLTFIWKSIGPQQKKKEVVFLETVDMSRKTIKAAGNPEGLQHQTIFF